MTKLRVWLDASGRMVTSTSERNHRGYLATDVLPEGVTVPNQIPRKGLDRATLHANLLHYEVVGLMRSTVQYGMLIGDLLNEIKAELPYGSYKSYVKRCMTFSYRTAALYTKMANEIPRLPKDQQQKLLSSGIASVQRFLASPQEDPHEGKGKSGNGRKERKNKKVNWRSEQVLHQYIMTGVSKSVQAGMQVPELLTVFERVGQDMEDLLNIVLEIKAEGTEARGYQPQGDFR